MKEPIKISLKEVWLEAFFQFLYDYIESVAWGQFADRDLIFAAYRGWRNTLFGIHDDEPSIQVKEFCEIIDSMCVPYLNGAYIMFRMKMMDMFTLGRFAEMMIDKINEPGFNAKEITPKN